MVRELHTCSEESFKKSRCTVAQLRIHTRVTGIDTQFACTNGEKWNMLMSRRPHSLKEDECVDSGVWVHAHKTCCIKVNKDM